MGSDNLHHKRKQRTLESYKRKIQKRDTYDVVLIVCEGKKTEPYYLQAFCDDLKLNSANIKVVGLGADPEKILEYALNEYHKAKDYDRVYCVFDKDQHTNYQNTLTKIQAFRQRKRNTIPIYSINSVPCFEYWLLLHFVNSTRPYIKAGKKTAGDLLLSEIKEHINDYYKGHQNIFNLTKSNLQTAISRAKKNYAHQKESDADNPSTNMFELIEYLINIKKSSFK